jgi:hypothetical protein
MAAVFQANEAEGILSFVAPPYGDQLSVCIGCVGLLVRIHRGAFLLALSLNVLNTMIDRYNATHGTSPRCHPLLLQPARCTDVRSRRGTSQPSLGTRSLTSTPSSPCKRASTPRSPTPRHILHDLSSFASERQPLPRSRLVRPLLAVLSARNRFTRIHMQWCVDPRSFRRVCGDRMISIVHGSHVISSAILLPRYQTEHHTRILPRPHRLCASGVDTGVPCARCLACSAETWGLAGQCCGGGIVPGCTIRADVDCFLGAICLLCLTFLIP